jgi:hypothetical protein
MVSASFIDRGPAAHHVMVRLADEGIPVGAIARALKKPSGDVWPVLKEAKQNGFLVEMPAADWPPGSRRDERTRTAAPIRSDEVEGFITPFMAAFGLPQSQARFLAILFARKEITKSGIYAALYDAESDVHPKIIDVFVCLVRKRLAPHQIRIETIWGRGFSLPSASIAALTIIVRDHARRAEIAA